MKSVLIRAVAICAVMVSGAYGYEYVTNGSFDNGTNDWVQWEVITEPPAPAGVLTMDAGEGNPAPSPYHHMTVGSAGGHGLAQVIPVVPLQTYTINADWKGDVSAGAGFGEVGYYWIEFCAYFATQAEVDDLYNSVILARMNQNPSNPPVIVAKKCGEEMLNRGWAPFDWEPITDSMGGGFTGAVGTNELIATQQYLVISTKIGGHMAEAWGWFDNVSVQGPLPGDANGDGKVDQSDFTILAINYEQPGVWFWADGDFNGDYQVDQSDFTILAIHYTDGAAPGTVPEPMSLLFVAAGVAAAGTVRRRR